MIGLKEAFVTGDHETSFPGFSVLQIREQLSDGAQHLVGMFHPVGSLNEVDRAAVGDGADNDEYRQ